jgi:hypothetical protein
MTAFSALFSELPAGNKAMLTGFKNSRGHQMLSF